MASLLSPTPSRLTGFLAAVLAFAWSPLLAGSGSFADLVRTVAPDTEEPEDAETGDELAASPGRPVAAPSGNSPAPGRAPLVAVRPPSASVGPAPVTIPFGHVLGVCLRC